MMACEEVRLWNYHWTTPLQGSDRTIVLMDALEFGASPQEARWNYRWSLMHKDRVRDEMVTYNRPSVVKQWEEECHWRYRCWDLLDDVLNCHFHPAEKLRRLYLLREMLGEDDYRSRRMPCPIPSYRTFER